MATIHYIAPGKGINQTGTPSVKDCYSVEIKIKNINCLYQFKLWKSPSEPTFFLVKPDSGLMKWIHPGDVLHMTYYSDDMDCPKKQFATRILNIHQENEGRFRGHFIVKLGIVEN